MYLYHAQHIHTTSSNFFLHQHQGPYNALEDARTFDDFFNHYQSQIIHIAKPMGYFIADVLNGMTHLQLETLKGLEIEVASEYEMSLTSGARAVASQENFEAFTYDDDNWMKAGNYAMYDDHENQRIQYLHYTQLEAYVAAQDRLATFCEPFMPEPPQLTIAQTCRLEIDFDTAAAAKRASLSDSELLYFMGEANTADSWVYMVENPFGFDAMAKVAEAKERETNPNECTDFLRLDYMRDKLSEANVDSLTFLEHYDMSDHVGAARYEMQLKATKFDRCVNVALFHELRDRQAAGETLTDVVQSQRIKMNNSRTAYDAVVAAEGGLCKAAFIQDCDLFDCPPPVLTTRQINQLCQEPLPDFHEELARLVSTYNEQELIQMYGVPYVWPLAHSVQMMDQPWSNYAIAGDGLANERYAEPSSCVDINRHDMMMEEAHDGGEYTSFRTMQ